MPDMLLFGLAVILVIMGATFFFEPPRYIKTSIVFVLLGIGFFAWLIICQNNTFTDHKINQIDVYEIHEQNGLYYANGIPILKYLHKIPKDGQRFCIIYHSKFDSKYFVYEFLLKDDNIDYKYFTLDELKKLKENDPNLILNMNF